MRQPDGVRMNTLVHRRAPRIAVGQVKCARSRFARRADRFHHDDLSSRNASLPSPANSCSKAIRHGVVTDVARAARMNRDDLSSSPTLHHPSMSSLERLVERERSVLRRRGRSAAFGACSF